MKIRNVLVTGGAGYVGSVLVPKLLNAGFTVTVLDWYVFKKDVFKTFKKNSKLREIKEDLRDEKILKKILKKTDAVIHLACISNDPSFEMDPKLGKSVNYDGTILLGQLAKDAGVSRFIYASSSSVYGVKKEKKVTETVSCEPLTDYSRYKKLSEEFLLTLNDPAFCVLILRPATVCGYGPRMRLDLTVNILTAHALVNKKMMVYGGNQYRPNIHIDDIADLYVNSLAYPQAKIAGEIFNAGYENMTVLAIAELVKKSLNDPLVQIDIKPTIDNRSYRIDSSKIQKVLGFKPRHTIRQAIEDIRNAYRAGILSNPFSDIHYYNIKTMNTFSPPYDKKAKSPSV